MKICGNYTVNINKTERYSDNVHGFKGEAIKWPRKQGPPFSM